MNVRTIRKIGLWIIVGVTLVALLVLNVIGETECLDIVVIVALIALAVWFLDISLCSRFRR